jgi:hypothetical protein
MDIKRSGSQPSGKGPAEYFSGMGVPIARAALAAENAVIATAIRKETRR